ncbi:hypothetical protein [Chryseobacterium limigenitum]|uniref:Uncharacterized protein n=1 Tax=Chryseobacterium limigenitum TaxID=1612149 RepID=A0A1K2IRV3_9FLAO|nr:hypothetical protein [Chryseobacterium limigenitum]SFZ95103.1 hypothetical protein SAMN05216324_108143 [Chryseobacterium limigenitum]
MAEPKNSAFYLTPKNHTMSLEILNNPLLGNSFSKVLKGNDPDSKLSDKNKYALESPFGKESFFYKAEEGSFRSFLEKKGKYIAVKKNFNDVDLEKIKFTEVYDKINIKYQ